jgi:hypothetical protein
MQVCGKTQPCAPFTQDDSFSEVLAHQAGGHVQALCVSDVILLFAVAHGLQALHSALACVHDAKCALAILLQLGIN